VLPTVRVVHGDDEADSYLEEMSEPQEEPTPVVPIEMGRTRRGFASGEFTDRYDNKCSIQESSLATEATIWLGIDDPKPEVLVPGEGWQPVDLKALVQGELSIHTRMHLTVEGVRQLLPLLHHFVPSATRAALRELSSSGRASSQEMG